MDLWILYKEEYNFYDMKKIIIFKNIVLLVALTMFGVAFFSLINNINPEEPTPYHYKDTRSDEQKKAEGGYFLNEYGNIIQPTNEELELFGTIGSRDFTLDKDAVGRVQIVEDVQFNNGDPTGHGDMYFFDEYVTGSTYGNQGRRDILYDQPNTRYVEKDWWFDNPRTKDKYRVKSQLDMHGILGYNFTHISPWYAFTSNGHIDPVTITHESVTSVNTDYNKNNGSASYFATVQDTDDRYREYGITVNGGPITKLTESNQIDRTPRGETTAWKDQDSTGKKANFNINHNIDNLGLGDYTFQLKGQRHKGTINAGWEDIGTSQTTTVGNKTDHPTNPRVTTHTTLVQPLPNGGNEGEIRISGDYTKANNSIDYPVTRIDVSKDDGSSWIEADTWSTTSNVWSHTFKDLTAQTYDFKVRLHHNGWPTTVVESGTSSYALIALPIPGGTFNFDYYEDANYIKASEGVANGEITLSGSYEDNNQLVTKVETAMSFDGGNTWSTWKQVDSSSDSANTFQTKLIGIPAGQVLTKVRLTYDSGTSSPSDDSTKESTPESYVMDEFSDPLLDEINSPMTLTPIEADYNTTNKSSMRLQVELHDPDDQIARIQVKYQITGSGVTWEMKDNLSFTSSSDKKIVDYTIPNLGTTKDYDFKMNVQLKRTGNWVEGYIKTGPSTTIEQPIEAVTTIGAGTKPSKWGLNDGKVSGTMIVPSPTNNSTVTKVDAYLKKTNDSSYSYLYPGAISTNGITNIEFIGDDINPIIASDDYYIEIEYDWKSNSGLTYPFIKTSGTTVVPVGPDFHPEVQINSTNPIAPTKWGLSDGKIHVNYKVINTYNADIQNYKARLYDSQGTFIPGKEVIEINPTPTNYAGEFVGLEAGNYTIKIFSDYELNGVTSTDMELISEGITIVDGIEVKPELYVENLSSTKPSKWGLSDGKIQFKYSTVNIYNADFTKATFKLYDNLGNHLDTKAVNNPPASGTLEFSGLLTGDYQIKAFMTYQINYDAIVAEEFSNQKTIAIGDGDDFPLEGIITNVKTEDVSYLGAEDGLISFDYEVMNLYNSDISEVKIIIEDGQGNPIDKREKNITSEALWTRSEEFKFLGAGIYRMKILATYEINESGIVTNETLFDSGTYRLSAANFIQPSSTHTVTITPHKMNILTNIEDKSGVIVEETLIITIEVNGKVEYEGNEMNIDIHYNENNIIWYAINVQADIKLPDGRIARWDGNNILEKVDYQPINEENNMIIILISIVISLLIMFILSLVLIKKMPSIKQRLLR